MVATGSTFRLPMLWLALVVPWVASVLTFFQYTAVLIGAPDGIAGADGGFSYACDKLMLVDLICSAVLFGVGGVAGFSRFGGSG